MASNRKPNYDLNEQIGFILRKVNQRHTGIFSKRMPTDLTPTRFAALVKLLEFGTLSQNELGRLTAMDVATIKGVVDRLRERDLVQSRPDPADARRQLIMLTGKGTEKITGAIPTAIDVTDETTAPLTEPELQDLLRLLKKIS